MLTTSFRLMTNQLLQQIDLHNDHLTSQAVSTDETMASLLGALIDVGFSQIGSTVLDVVRRVLNMTLNYM